MKSNVPILESISPPQPVEEKPTKTTPNKTRLYNIYNIHIHISLSLNITLTYHMTMKRVGLFATTSWMFILLRSTTDPHLQNLNFQFWKSGNLHIRYMDSMKSAMLRSKEFSWKGKLISTICTHIFSTMYTLINSKRGLIIFT